MILATFSSCCCCACCSFCSKGSSRMEFLLFKRQLPDKKTPWQWRTEKYQNCVAAAGLAAGCYLLPAGCLLRAWCLLTGGCWTCFGERMRNTCRQQNAMTLKDEPSPKYASRRRNIPSEILLAAAAALTAAGAGLAAAAATAAALTAAAAAKLALANACETPGFATPKHHLIWFSKRRQNEPPEIPNVPSGTLLPNTKTLVQYCLSCCCCCSVAFLAAVALRLLFFWPRHTETPPNFVPEKTPKWATRNP